eukprot:6188909-Pleurochrysis_carterae.AAC.3
MRLACCASQMLSYESKALSLAQQLQKAQAHRRPRVRGPSWVRLQLAAARAQGLKQLRVCAA